MLASFKLRIEREEDAIYVGVFICLTMKKVHLELISSLPSEPFIQALHRYDSRQGRSSKIY